jgi:hypothetical protein
MNLVLELKVIAFVMKWALNLIAIAVVVNLMFDLTLWWILKDEEKSQPIIQKWFSYCGSSENWKNSWTENEKHHFPEFDESNRWIIIDYKAIDQYSSACSDFIISKKSAFFVVIVCYNNELAWKTKNGGIFIEKADNYFKWTEVFSMSKIKRDIDEYMKET